MKKWERIIIYGLFSFTIAYSLWASNKLNTIHRINKECFIPTYEQLQLLRNDPAENHYQSLVNADEGEITVTDFAFSIHEKQLGWWGFGWDANVLNTKPYWVNGIYIIEFRNSNESLLETFISPGNFPNGPEARRVSGVCWLPTYAAKQVDFAHSSVSIKIVESP